MQQFPVLGEVWACKTFFCFFLSTGLGPWSRGTSALEVVGIYQFLKEFKNFYALLLFLNCLVQFLRL